MEPYAVKRGAQEPALRVTFYQGDGTPVDLTGATVVFSMVDRLKRSVKVNAAAAAVIDGPNGVAQYNWTVNDTDTVGHYDGEFKATLAGGRLLILPAEDDEDGRYIPIEVVERLV